MTKTNYQLYNYDTGKRIGRATQAQVEASLAVGPAGAIEIDEDGDVLADEQAAADHRNVGGVTRTVYVQR